MDDNNQFFEEKIFFHNINITPSLGYLKKICWIYSFLYEQECEEISILRLLIVL